MHADTDGIVPGNALVVSFKSVISTIFETLNHNQHQVDPKKQFRPLSKFGNAFLNRSTIEFCHHLSFAITGFK